MVWYDILQEFGGFGSDLSSKLLDVTKGLVKKWHRQQIVMLVDEITHKYIMSDLGKQTFPESVRMILILNPKTSEEVLFSLPDSFLL